MIHFFEVIIEGFNQILCSRCEQVLLADPEVNIIFAGPCTEPAISCAMCGVSRTDTEETAQDRR